MTTTQTDQPTITVELNANDARLVAEILGDYAMNAEVDPSKSEAAENVYRVLR